MNNNDLSLINLSEIRFLTGDTGERENADDMMQERGLLTENFIEGMACAGGCVGGAGCLTHVESNVSRLDKYAVSGKEELCDDIKSL